MNLTPIPDVPDVPPSQESCCSSCLGGIFSLFSKKKEDEQEKIKLLGQETINNQYSSVNESKINIKSKKIDKNYKKDKKNKNIDFKNERIKEALTYFDSNSVNKNLGKTIQDKNQSLNLKNISPDKRAETIIHHCFNSSSGIFLGTPEFSDVRCSIQFINDNFDYACKEGLGAVGLAGLGLAPEHQSMLDDFVFKYSSHSQDMQKLRNQYLSLYLDNDDFSINPIQNQLTLDHSALQYSEQAQEIEQKLIKAIQNKHPHISSNSISALLKHAQNKGIQLIAIPDPVPNEKSYDYKNMNGIDDIDGKMDNMDDIDGKVDDVDEVIDMDINKGTKCLLGKYEILKNLDEKLNLQKNKKFICLGPSSYFQASKMNGNTISNIASYFPMKCSIVECIGDADPDAYSNIILEKKLIFNEDNSCTINYSSVFSQAELYEHKPFQEAKSFFKDKNLKPRVDEVFVSIPNESNEVVVRDLMGKSANKGFIIGEAHTYGAARQFIIPALSLIKQEYKRDLSLALEGFDLHAADVVNQWIYSESQEESKEMELEVQKLVNGVIHPYKERKLETTELMHLLKFCKENKISILGIDLPFTLQYDPSSNRYLRINYPEWKFKYQNDLNQQAQSDLSLRAALLHYRATKVIDKSINKKNMTVIGLVGLAHINTHHEKKGYLAIDRLTSLPSISFFNEVSSSGLENIRDLQVNDDGSRIHVHYGIAAKELVEQKGKLKKVVVEPRKKNQPLI